MASGNMYEEILAQTWGSYDAHLEGNGSGLVCIVSTRALCEAARAALEKSVAALGYGEHACTFAILTNSGTVGAPTSDGGGALDEETHDEGALGRGKLDGGALDPAELFRLVEGLDPICVIGTDADAAQALEGAYRQDIPLDAPFRLFGRDAVSFRSFTLMLDDAQSKQVAWSLLKKLPRMKKR